MYCQNTLEMHQKLIEALIDLKDSNSDDKEIICNHMLDKSPTSDLVNCLNLVQSLIKKELSDMKITELPSFVGFFLVDITKYGPWLLLQPKCPGLEKAKDGVIASLIEKLTDASSIDFALKFSSMIEMYFNNHISVKYQNFLQKNLSEARILKSLQERLSNKIQDFPYFQKFSRLQAKFLLEKFERTFEETQKSSQVKKDKKLIDSYNKWIEELDNNLYKAFDPHFTDFSEGIIPLKKIKIKELGKNLQRQISAPINSKTLIDVSINEAPESLARVQSSKENYTTNLFQVNEPSIPPEKAQKNNTLLKPRKVVENASKNAISDTRNFNKYRLDPDLRKMEFFIQYSDIEEVESVTIPQRLFYLNHNTIV